MTAAKSVNVRGKLTAPDALLGECRLACNAPAAADGSGSSRTHQCVPISVCCGHRHQVRWTLGPLHNALSLTLV